MTIISANNIKYSNAKGILFNNATFSVDEIDRIGIVGNNGSGKSTLVKCIVGELILDDGNIHIRKGTIIGYVEQDVPKELESKTIYEALALSIPEEERIYSEYKVDMVLNTIKIPEKLLTLKVSELSEGWKRLVLIIMVYMKNPTLLVLDEPTNHLDLSKIIYLERLLKDVMSDIPYIIISHDRKFLDNCINKTIILRDRNVYSFKHNYSESMRLLAEQDEANKRKRGIQEKEIERLSKTAKDFKQKGKAHGSERLARTAITLESRISKMENDLVEVYKEKDRNINLSDNEIDYNKPVIKIYNFNVKTPDNLSLLYNIKDLEISKGERIVILGLNGTGKSLLIRELMKTYNSTSDIKNSGITFNPRVKVGYVDQVLSILPPNENLKDFIQGNFHLDITSAIASLARIGFDIGRQNTLIKELSFGEKTRLAFLKLKHEYPNLYIMDEPTNHLDIDAQMKLEQAILENDNPCIFVSHDRTFVEKIANKYYMIDEKEKTLKLINSTDIFFDILLRKMEEGDDRLL